MNHLTRFFCVSALTLLTCFRNYSQSGEFSSETISVGVVVSDLDKSLKFYTNVLGLKKASSFAVNADMGKRTGLTDGVPVSITVLKLGDSKTATDWKLMSFGKPAAHPKQQHLQDDTGMQYITIHVKSLKPFLARCKENNVKLLGDTPIPLGGDQHFALIQDPDGTFIELIGPLE
ncbi:MAG TPA: VOC family protein [Verrucomicrobiota bacterium]|nr:glyoxalase [Verrucomicrobiales bacterium]HRI14464.1 VOC family protein [Verrucomicrobiota bacterium]